MQVEVIYKKINGLVNLKSIQGIPGRNPFAPPPSFVNINKRILDEGTEDPFSRYISFSPSLVILLRPVLLGLIG
jgi:hypothetical protein